MTTLGTVEFSGFYGAASRYSLRPSFLLGKIFGGDARTNESVSLLGDGHLQGGYLGSSIEDVILVLLLWFVEQATQGSPLRVSATIFLMATLALASGGITTVILTHGFGLAILICAMLPRTGWSTKPPDRSGPRRSWP